MTKYYSVPLFLLVTFATVISAKIDPSVHSKLTANPTVDIFVSLHDGTASVLKKISSSSRSSVDRVEQVTSALQNHAQINQKNVLKFLNKAARTRTQKQIVVKSFWISNQIYVGNADEELVSALALLTEVSHITLNHVFPLPSPVSVSPSDISLRAEWGLVDIGAEQVWNMVGGNAGEGVRVATIDTGVRFTHEILRDNYMGEYGWYDPYDLTTEPNDSNGHGTHVMGTIVGRLGVGVAPNATYMACKGCGPIGCVQTALLECAEFVMSPTLPDGTNRNSSKAAHVVNNSWNGGKGQSYMDAAIAAWQAAGITPVFSAGNSGANGCGSVEHPGDLVDVITAGATNRSNEISWFSSRGPSVYGVMKPDVSAPGFEVRSSWGTGDFSYAVASGTSMAAPHVTGSIALLKSANPSITYDQIKSLISRGARQEGLMLTEQICSLIRNSKFPNHFFGNGVINVFNSISILKLEAC